MAVALNIRCPYCLHDFETVREGSVNRELRCPRCTRPFLFRNALRGAKAPAAFTVMSDEPRPPPEGTIGRLPWVLAAAIGLLTVGTFRRWSPTLEGPEFLVLYAGLLGLLLMASFLIRWIYKDVDDFRWMGVLVFEAVGVFRFFDGYASGMRRFELLLVLMVFGGVFFFARAKHLRGAQSGSGCGSSSGCGSGSSGCGGGGGCGGCGG